VVAAGPRRGRASLLIRDEPRANQDYRIWLHPFHDAEAVWFDARADGWDRAAAPSPDGRSIAVVSDADDDNADDPDAGIAIVSVIDLADGKRRRLITAPGGWSDETVVGWSSDGTRVAATVVDERPSRCEESGRWVVAGRAACW
jgi:Tol biopolymer transport system component